MIIALTAGRAAYGGGRGRAREAPSRDGPGGGARRSSVARRPLHARCRFSYEMRLHRARGYGALKAVLGVLATRSR